MDLRFVTLMDLSDRTGLPVAWLRAEADAGRLPFVQVGRSRMFLPEEIARTLRERGARAREEVHDGAA